MRCISVKQFWLTAVALAAMSVAAGANVGPPKNYLNIGPAEAGGTDKCVRVLAPQAVCMSISDVASVVVVGVAPPEDGALLVHTLDASGAVTSAEPARVALVKPASLAAFRVVPTAVYSHPRLPLIYVWQDLTPASGTPTVPPADVVHRDFDHLLIYKVAANKLELVKATARGAWFSYNIAGAWLGSDASATVAQDDRLYLPNIQRPNPDDKTTPYTPMFGYVTLDANGMPEEADGALAIKTWVDLTNYAHVERPMGVIPVSKQTVLYGSYMVMASLEMEGLGQVFSIHCLGSHMVRATGHPTLQRIYGVGLNTAQLFTIEHVDGMFTMLPQAASISGLAVLSYPVIDAKANQVIVGGAGGVHLIPLDERGLIAGTQYRFIVGHPVRAVDYSHRFDRVYVPVEKLE